MGLIRKFKSYSEAMKAVLPNHKTMRNIAKRTKEHCIFRLENNEASGKELADSTINKKINRGAKTPFIKLVEGGGLSEQMKTKATSYNAEIGYYSEKHKKFKPYDQDIKVCDLVDIHHNGKNNLPERKFLEIDKPVQEIIKDEIRKRIVGV